MSAQAAIAAIGVASPLLELVFRTFDPSKMAQRLVHVFTEWHKRSQIDRASAQAMLRTYRARSRKLRSDYSFGAADAMARVLGLTSVDLEAWGEMAYESPPLGEGRTAGGGGGGGGDAPPSSAGSTTSSSSGSNSTSSTSGVSGSDAYQAEMARLRSALEGSAAWRFLSGPGLPASATVYMTSLMGEHSILLSASSHPNATAGGHLTAAEVLSSQQMSRIVVPLLFAGCVRVCDARDNVMMTMDRSERYGMMRV